jgi:flagellar basal body rod protein FlgG
MVTMMEALRRAESAQRLVNAYDDILGRALSTFGKA